MIEFIACGWNCEKYVRRCVESVLSQNCNHWKLHLIDDCSKDNTLGKISDMKLETGLQDQIRVYNNNERMGKLYNFNNVVRNYCQDDSIIASLDLDDYLAHDKVVELLLGEYEDPDLWVAWTQLKHFPGDELGKSHQPPDDVDIRQYRKDGEWPFWQTRTFRKKLFDKIDEIDFIDIDGKFYKYAADYAIMFPLVEMAGPKRRKFIDDVAYVYNIENPLRDTKKNIQQQVRIAHDIMNKTRYKQLEEL